MVLILPGKKGFLGGMSETLIPAYQQAQQAKQKLLAEESASKRELEAKEKLLEAEYKKKEELEKLKISEKAKLANEYLKGLGLGGFVQEDEGNITSEQAQDALGVTGPELMEDQKPPGTPQVAPIGQKQPKPDQQDPDLSRFTPEVLAKMSANPLLKPVAESIQKNQELQQKKIKAERSEQIEFHKESEKYDEGIRESASRVKKQNEAIADIRDAIKSHKVKPNMISNWFKGFGKVGDKIADAFKNAEQGKMEAALPVLLEGWKDVFGVRLSDADLKILQDKLPNIGKSAEANEAILNVIEKYSRPALLREQIAREIKKQNGGLRPLGFADKVEEELERRMPVKMKDASGVIYEIPGGEVQEAMKDGLQKI